MIGNARFDFIHFMHYTALPENQKEFPSLWVDFPNKYFDPERGYELYQRYLSQLVLADKLGFDAVVVNEHHNTAYSMMPAPNLIAATLIPQVKNAKICVWGTPPNLEHPNRLAEEYAMLDVLSQGRLEVAFPLGTGMEYWSNSVNPATARERHRESIEIILQAWTQDGPTRITATSTLIAISIRGRVRCRSRIRPATSSAPAVRRPSISRLEARLRLRVGVRHQTTGARAQSRNCAAAQPSTATTSGRTSFRCK